MGLACGQHGALCTAPERDPASPEGLSDSALSPPLKESALGLGAYRAEVEKVLNSRDRTDCEACGVPASPLCPPSGTVCAPGGTADWVLRKKLLCGVLS